MPLDLIDELQRVVSREGLIAMKLSSNRPQDQADVIRLTEADR